LLNQCPHNLDLLAWICGEPSSVVGFCNEGRYHNIEVEDDVTLYMEWKNGATGVFIASTGEAAGVNRLEISLDDALIVCEKGRLRLGVLDKPEAEYRSGNGDMFAKPVCEWQDIDVAPAERAYEKVLEAFAQGRMIAAGDEAISSLYISNAAYLSSWQNHRKVDIPSRASEYELEFEREFERELGKRS
jgi:predicted dehydrogenase